MGQTATGHFDGAGTGVDPAGAQRVYRTAGAPSAGTDEVQTITFGGSPTAATFKLALRGIPTAAITWSATNTTLVANIDAALEALFGAGTVTTAVGTMTAGVGTITVTFTGALGKQAVPTMTVHTNNTGGTIAVAETTPGVDATYRGVPKGAVLSDETNGKLYQNTGTAAAPTWTAVGTQT